MSGATESGDFVVLPLPGGGSLIISSHPASLPAASLQEAIGQYGMHGATALLSLTTEQELLALNLGELPEACKAAGLIWWHAPIEDMGEPDESFERWWNAHTGALHGLFNNEGTLAMHCWSGYGRSGTVAARILVERGMTPDQALVFVRQHRPGAVETVGQERYVLGLALPK